MNEFGHFENLLSFLTVEFSDASLEGKSDEEIIDACVRPELAGWYRRVVKEGHAILKRREFPWQDVGDYANRDFISEEEGREWLQTVLELVERRLRRFTG